jgi:hypothetical protein
MTQSATSHRSCSEGSEIAAAAPFALFLTPAASAQARAALPDEYLVADDVDPEYTLEVRRLRRPLRQPETNRTGYCGSVFGRRKRVRGSY